MGENQPGRPRVDALNIMNPQPIGNAGQAADAKDGGAPKEAHGCTVIDVSRDGANLVVTLASSSVEKLVSPQARQLAYAQRFDHGYATAGIDAGTGSYVPPEEMTNARREGRQVQLWYNDFKLTPGL